MKKYRQTLGMLVTIMFVLCCSNASASPIVNPSFEDGPAGLPTVPTGWSHNDSAYFSGWVANSPFTHGTHYYRLWSIATMSCPVGAYESISQSVDLTEVYEILFDVYLASSRHKAVFLVDGVPYWTKASSGTYLDQLINVSALSGFHTIELRQECIVAESDSQSTKTKWDNLRTIGLYADYPNPADGAKDIDPNVTLSWLAGYFAADVNGHDVYFGTDFNEVNEGINGTSQRLQSTTEFTPGSLDYGKTYFWRVDEVNDTNVWEGDVWRFTVNGPEIGLSATDIHFYTEEGIANPPVQILTITNTGVGTLHWQITETCDWLTAEPNNGSSTGEANQVTISVDTAGLTMDNYTCELTISDFYAENNPQIVQITLHIYGSYDPNNLLVPLEYPTIQEAIYTAVDGDIILIAPGTYTGTGNRDIDFLGKAITVCSVDPNNSNIVATTVIDCNGSYGNQHRGFHFHNSEDVYSILAGITIINGYIEGDMYDQKYGGGILCEGASPTIKNCTFGNNRADQGGGLYGSNGPIANCTFTGNDGDGGGGLAYCDGLIINCVVTNNDGGSAGGGLYNCNGQISNCIVWENSDSAEGQLAGCSMPIYSCIQDWMESGNGNISTDPCFVDPCNGDYHLKSEGWSWDRNANQWCWDDVTSRCIDAGNPGSDIAGEPVTLVVDPLNRWGENLRINMGAYGGTIEASMPPYDWALLADLTNDGTVNFTDFAAAASDWQVTAETQPGDLDRNGTVNMAEIYLFTEDWLKETIWR